MSITFIMNSRCFVLHTADDDTLQTCRFKAGTKKTPPMVILNGKAPNPVTLAGSIPFAENSTLEMWQIDVFDENTVLANVFNIPLLSTFLVYPLVLRMVTQGELPTVGRLKKMLCEQLVQTVENQFIKEEDDEVMDEELVHEPPSLLVDEPDDDDDIMESDGIDSTDMSDMEDDEGLEDEDEVEEDDVEDDDDEGMNMDV